MRVDGGKLIKDLPVRTATMSNLRRSLLPENELLMKLIRSGHQASTDLRSDVTLNQLVPALAQEQSQALPVTVSLEQIVRAWHSAGRSQRAIARDLNIDRRKVKHIIDRDVA